jgi:hypothetical protein
VLREVARWSERSGPSSVLRDEDLAHGLGRDRNDASYLRVLHTLISEGYLDGRELKTMTSYEAMILGLTSKGYQAIGEWPSEERMTTIDVKKQMRAAVMNRLYDRADGATTTAFDLHELGEEAGLSGHDAEEVGRYLEDEGLITFMGVSGPGGAIALTHLGVVEVEHGRQVPSSPTEHFPPYQNIINFHGSVTGAQIQQASPGAHQQGTFELSPEAILAAVQQVRAALADVEMDEAERELVEQNLLRAEKNAGRSDAAGRRIVRGALVSVGTVIAGMVSSGAYVGLAHLLPLLPH